MAKTIAYVRVSTDEQDYKNQKYEILHYCDRNRLNINQWIELEVSARKSSKIRKIDAMVESLNSGDMLIVSELSRLGRSTSDVIQLVKVLTSKGVEFIAIKQNLNVNATNSKDIASKVIITIFSLLAELESDMISERTKTALARVKASGKSLGRPKGPGKSRLDGKEYEIKGLLKKGVTRSNIAKILEVSWGTLENFITKKMRD